MPRQKRVLFIKREITREKEAYRLSEEVRKELIVLLCSVDCSFVAELKVYEKRD